MCNSGRGIGSLFGWGLAGLTGSHGRIKFSTLLVHNLYAKNRKCSHLNRHLLDGQAVTEEFMTLQALPRGGNGVAHHHMIHLHLHGKYFTVTSAFLLQQRPNGCYAKGKALRTTKLPSYVHSRSEHKRL